MSRRAEHSQRTRRRILFISLRSTHFVELDRKTLDEQYDVRSFQFYEDSRSRLAFLFRAAAQFVWLLREVRGADLVYGWFVDYHMALPLCLARVFRRPVVAVLGGFDCNTLPDLDYGVFASSWRGPLARRIFRRLTLLLPTTGALISSVNNYATFPDQHRDGVLTHVPDLRTPYRIVPLGIDTKLWPVGSDVRADEVVTVAYIRDDRTLKVKGIDVYLQVALRLPDVNFKVVGVDPDFETSMRRRYTVPRNVQLVPPQSQTALRSFYQSASVYLQLSRTEALPNVVKEAMCCGCIPVGSAVAGIPEVIGGEGLLVQTPDPDEIADTVQRALDGATPKRRIAARRRIIENFGHERRRELLLDTLNELMEPPVRHA